MLIIKWLMVLIECDEQDVCVIDIETWRANEIIVTSTMGIWLMDGREKWVLGVRFWFLFDYWRRRMEFCRSGFFYYCRVLEEPINGGYRLKIVDCQRFVVCVADNRFRTPLVLNFRFEIRREFISGHQRMWILSAYTSWHRKINYKCIYRQTNSLNH